MSKVETKELSLSEKLAEAKKLYVFNEDTSGYELYPNEYEIEFNELITKIDSIYQYEAYRINALSTISDVNYGNKAIEFIGLKLNILSEDNSPEYELEFYEYILNILLTHGTLLIK